MFDEMKCPCGKDGRYSHFKNVDGERVEVVSCNKYKVCDPVNPKLVEALAHPLWVDHVPFDTYTMDGKGVWELWYYPIMGNGETQEPYDEPRALMKTEKMYGGKMGMDLREVPLRYIKRIGNESVKLPIIREISHMEKMVKECPRVNMTTECEQAILEERDSTCPNLVNGRCVNSL